MCGILAIIGEDIGHLYDAVSARSAIEAVSHRGPDNLGLFQVDNCILGHTRLAILGLDDSANQPFHRDRYVITYNGEIFNFVELKIELQNIGISFETESDTEVVLHAFQQWGNQAFCKFNGMWALAIYDKDTGCLTVSRDRFGQKPMFYSRLNNAWHFASEPRQLVELHGDSADYQAITSFLREGDGIPVGDTFFTNIKEVPPASIINISPDGSFTKAQFWQYPIEDPGLRNDEVFSDFEKLLEDAVKLRLRADVPLSICLSGGVDSTVVASIASRLSSKPISAYTFSSEDKHDEASYAKEVAKRLNLQLKTVTQPGLPDDYIKQLKSLVLVLGRGHSSPAIVSNDLLHGVIAAEGIKVSLDGQGADELLGGYKSYYFQHLMDSLLRLNIREMFYTFVEMSKQRKQFQFGAISILIDLFRRAAPSRIRYFMRWIYGYEKFFKKVYRERVVPSLDWGVQRRSKLLVNEHLKNQHMHGLRNLLFYGDAVAMRRSVENRSPFMDHRLVEFCFRRDAKIKIWRGNDKAAIKFTRDYRKFMDILDRDKIGFNSVLKENTKADMCRRLMESEILNFSFLNKDEIVSAINRGDLMSEKYDRFLFRLFQVHLWFELFKHRLN